MGAPIRIAISGGGITGAALMHALLPYQHLDVHIFESAPQFREAGIAFGIGRNATAALNLISATARACLDRAGGVQMKGSAFWVAQGPDSGKKVFQLDNSTTIVQRANLLHELLANVPSHRMHASKKLVSIDQQHETPVVMHFADGSQHECDILIGADGVHSKVRRIILGENDPAAAPRNTKWWGVMTLNPYEKARATLGKIPVDIEDAREYAWGGNGSFMMNNVLNHGETVQFAVFSNAELPHADAEDQTNQWTRKVDSTALRDLYLDKGWMPHLDIAVRELLCDEPSRQAIYLWEHLDAHTYVSGPVCVIGDAAHATTPFMGSGGGMCVEDALVMSALLARATSPTEAVAALKVYDRVRRPRTQQVVEASRKTGDIICGIDPTVGLDSVKLEAVMAGRWDFIFDFDIGKHRNDALNQLEAELK